MVEYYINISGKYALVIYEFNNNNELTKMQITANTIAWTTEDIPHNIESNFMKPDELYSTLYDELTKSYGNPRIESDKAIWKNEFETIEGSIKDYTRQSGDSGSGKIYLCTQINGKCHKLLF